MKTVKLISKIVVLLALINAYPAYSINQNEVKEKYENSYKLSPNGKFVFGVYDSDLKVNVWKNSEVKIIGEIIITGGDAADKEKLIQAFKSPEVSSDADQLEIDTEFWKNIMSSGLTTKVTLKNGDKIKIDKFKATFTIWIPESIVFDLNSKYNNIEVADFAGVFNFDLYDADIKTGNFGDNCKFNAKYSSLILGSGGNTKFDIYDCKVVAQNLKNVQIESKYSNFRFASANEVNINSYDDDFDIKKLSRIEANAKYSLFLLDGQMGNSTLDVYDSDVKGGSYQSLKYFAKYSELVADKIGDLSITSIYDCTVKINQINNFTCDESKYDEINFGLVGNSIKMPNAHDIQLRVGKVSSTFTWFEGNFKYGTIVLTTDPALNYKLAFESTYGTFIYPKEKFSKKPLTHIEKDSKIQFESSTDPNAKCEINFTAYDIKFTIE